MKVDDQKTLNLGKAVLSIINNVKTKVKEMEMIVLELEGQKYRLHISKWEDPIIYTRGVIETKKEKVKDNVVEFVSKETKALESAVKENFEKLKAQIEKKESQDDAK